MHFARPWLEACSQDSSQAESCARTLWWVPLLQDRHPCASIALTKSWTYMEISQDGMGWFWVGVNGVLVFRSGATVSTAFSAAGGSVLPFVIGGCLNCSTISTSWIRQCQAISPALYITLVICSICIHHLLPLGLCCALRAVGGHIWQTVCAWRVLLGTPALPPQSRHSVVPIRTPLHSMEREARPLSATRVKHQVSLWLVVPLDMRVGVCRVCTGSPITWATLVISGVLGK